MGNAFNIEPEFVVEQLTGVAGGYEFAVAEELDVTASEFEQLGFLLSWAMRAITWYVPLAN